MSSQKKGDTRSKITCAYARIKTMRRYDILLVLIGVVLLSTLLVFIPGIPGDQSGNQLQNFIFWLVLTLLVISLVYLTVAYQLRKRRISEWRFGQRWILGKSMHIIGLSSVLIEDRDLISDAQLFKDSYARYLNAGSASDGDPPDEVREEEYQPRVPSLEGKLKELEILQNELQKLTVRFAHVMDHKAVRWLRYIEEMNLHTVGQITNDGDLSSIQPVIESILEEAEYLEQYYWNIACNHFESRRDRIPENGLLYDEAPLYMKILMVGVPSDIRDLIAEDREYVVCLIWVMIILHHRLMNNAEVTGIYRSVPFWL